MTAFWPETIRLLMAKEDLEQEQAAEAARRILSGDATPAQVAAFAIALRAKGETPQEMGGLARAVLELAPPVEAPGPVLDTSGTGGDGAGTFNVSTIAAIVAAGAGGIVAKQATRPVSSRCGSADLLEALGVRVDLPASGVAKCIQDCGIGAIFAPRFHPELARVAELCREIGTSTVFDVVTPLVNPARPAAQLVGVADPTMLAVVAGVLADRGTKGYVVRGVDGMDEITTTGPTEIREASRKAVLQYHILPIEVGVKVARPEDLGGGDQATNARLARSVLAGEAGPARDIVAVNAGAALTVGGLASDLQEGLGRACESIDSGKAAGVLARWVEMSNRA